MTLPPFRESHNRENSAARPACKSRPYEISRSIFRRATSARSRASSICSGLTGSVPAPALPCLSSFFSLLKFTCSARDSSFGGKLVSITAYTPARCLPVRRSGVLNRAPRFAALRPSDALGGLFPRQPCAPGTSTYGESLLRKMASARQKTSLDIAEGRLVPSDSLPREKRHRHLQASPEEIFRANDAAG